MAANERVSASPGLAWCRSVLDAITAIQQQLEPGSRHSDSITCILGESLKLTGSQSGMLANVSDGEPCRLTETVASSESRDVTLALFDRAARSALRRGKPVISRPANHGEIAALPLKIGRAVHGVLVLSRTEPAWSEELLESMAPLCGTAASVFRQFEEDLSAQQVDAVFDNLADGIITANNEGVVEFMNPAAEQIFGYNLEEVVGKSARMLLPEPYASRHDEYLARYRETGEAKIVGYGRELDGRHKDGTVFPMDVSVSQIEVQGRQVFVVITRDITEHKANKTIAEKERANSQTLELLVRIDALTGIANRRHFDEALTEEVRRAARNAKPVSLILCDIDFFKAFNDRYGHLAGDKALRSTAKAIDSCFQRAGEVAARYGGEEFGIVIPDTDLEAAEILAKKMREKVIALSIPHSMSPVADYLTISIGVASAVPGPHFDETQLVEEADRALYRAKGSGRDRIELADSGKRFPRAGII